MFKVSSQEEFGLRFLVHLAKSEGKEVSLADIATKEGISLPYVRKIFGILRDGGLVKASKGVTGGYSLTHQPEELTLKTIFQALKPEPHEFSCNDFTGQLSVCANFGDCGLRPLLSLLQNKINNFLDGISLSQLIKEEKSVKEDLTNRFQETTHITAGSSK
jgi:Rrf2 family protein